MGSDDGKPSPDAERPAIRVIRVQAPNRPNMNRELATGVEGWAELHSLNRALRFFAGLPPDPVVDRTVVNCFRRVPK